MCNFFSFCMDEYGKKYYFDWQQRLEQKHQGVDSHDHIISYYKLDDGKVSKFEYNPILKRFIVDKIGLVDNSVQAEEWVRKLDFKKIIELLIIKEIVNPLELPKVENVTDEQIEWLKEWASVGASVWDLVRDLVGTSVWDLVRASVRTSVWDLVRASVGASVWDLVWASVGASVGASVWASVWASVGAYTSSFFDIEYKYDFSPCVKLCEGGLVPSFDGTTWRLHSGKNADIVYEMKGQK